MSLQSDLQVDEVRELLIVLGELITAFDLTLRNDVGYFMINHLFQDLITAQLYLSKTVRKYIHKLQSELLANPTNLIVRVMNHSRLLTIECNDYNSLLEIVNNENAFVDFIRKYGCYSSMNTQYSTDIIGVLIDPKHPLKYNQAQLKTCYGALLESYKQLEMSTRFNL